MHLGIDYAALARRMLADGETTASMGKLLGISQSAASRLATDKSGAGRRGAISAITAERLIRAVGGRIEIPPAAVVERKKAA